MPYEIKPNPDGDGFEVINKDTGKVHAKHSTKEDAKSQVRLLEAEDHGWQPTRRRHRWGRYR